ncbi:MAG TPA: cupin domain-containing protein [Acidobacteriaceae bacterium]|jgi:mannose-6-phosphate isomerase-like protein (cupin superfamily)|nr:cupin domain-containing protein [Acidobacteriaceae bacterium]
MDVRNIQEVEPIVEHNGSTPVWYLVRPGTMRAVTEGGQLELVNEFEVPAGSAVFSHSHPTHEFYYVLYGRGRMIIGDEERPISQGDFVYIPPNEPHSLETASPHAPLRCFCFAVTTPEAGEINYTSH